MKSSMEVRSLSFALLQARPTKIVPGAVKASMTLRTGRQGQTPFVITSTHHRLCSIRRCVQKSELLVAGLRVTKCRDARYGRLLVQRAYPFMHPASLALVLGKPHHAPILTASSRPAIFLLLFLS